MFTTCETEVNRRNEENSFEALGGIKRKTPKTLQQAKYQNWTKNLLMNLNK
jgi:hypothetical protein